LENVVVFDGIKVGEHFSHIKIFLVTFHEHFGGFLVESTFRERNNKQTSDNFINSFQIPTLGIPVSFESVDTDFTSLMVNIGMKYFSSKVAFGRGLWEIRGQLKFDSEYSTFIWSSCWAGDICLQVIRIVIQYYFDVVQLHL